MRYQHIGHMRLSGTIWLNSFSIQSPDIGDYLWPTTLAVVIAVMIGLDRGQCLVDGTVSAERPRPKATASFAHAVKCTPEMTSQSADDVN